MKYKLKIVSLFTLLLLGLVGTTLFMPLEAQAASCGGQETSVISCDDETNGVWGILIVVINILAAGVGVVAVGGLVYAAILYASAADNSNQIAQAKSVITNTVIGLISFALMFSVLQFIIPGGMMNVSPPDVAKEKEKDKDKDKKSGGDSKADSPEDSAKTIRVTHLHSSGRYDRSTALWKSDLQKLKDQYSPDIITLTEASNRTSAVSWNGWSHTNGESIVAWDTSTWRKVKADVKVLAPDVHFFRRIMASVVVLEHKQTKTKWLWVSSHIPSSVDGGDGKFGNEADRVAKWKACMSDLSATVNNTMQAYDIQRRHSVVTADWNVNVAQDGWRDVMANYFPNRTPSNSIGSAGTHGNRTIDSSLITSDLEAVSWRSLGTIPSSDHKPFLAKYKADK